MTVTLVKPTAHPYLYYSTTERDGGEKMMKLLRAVTVALSVAVPAHAQLAAPDVAGVVAPDGIRIELQEDPNQREDVIGYHIHFITSEYRELMAWYVENFGLNIAYLTDPSGVYIELTEGYDEY